MRCSAGSCVEVTWHDGWVLVRDTKDPDREPIAYRPATWTSTVLAPIMLHRIPMVVDNICDDYEWTGHTVDGAEHRLLFTDEEWRAFEDGVRAGRFTPERLNRKCGDPHDCTCNHGCDIP